MWSNDRKLLRANSAFIDLMPDGKIPAKLADLFRIDFSDVLIQELGRREKIIHENEWVNSVIGTKCFLHSFTFSDAEGATEYCSYVQGAAELSTESQLRVRETKMRRQNEALLKLAKSSIIENNDLLTALQEITQTAADILACERASIWFYDEVKSEIAIFDLFEKTPRRHSSGKILKAKQFPAYFNYLLEERVLPAHDAVTDPNTYEFSESYFKPLGITSLLDAPIRVGGKMVGVLCNEQVGNPRVWTSEEQIFAASLADIIARTIEIENRKKAEIALKQLLQTLEKRVAERTEELEIAKSRVEQASSAKSRFLAMMSHEIRTPMNGILGIARLMKPTVSDPEHQRQLAIIVESAELLLTILNDILDFSKIEADRLALEVKPTNLNRLVSGVVELTKNGCEKQLDIRLDIEDDLPQNVECDATRLRQVLMNLMNNAVKFTERGHVCLKVRKISEKNRRVLLHFSVADTGIGIAEAIVPKIFRPYEQADASTARKYGGTGLGLPIASQLVQLMAGKLEVKSTVGRGSDFHFDVEFALATQGEIFESKDEKGAKADHLPDPTMASRHPIKILMAEDNEVNQIVTQASLAAFGYLADLAVNGREALQMAREGDYDLILMDLYMPEMDGHESARKIRALTGIQQPKIIAVTANMMLERENAELLGYMDGILIKPFELALLKDVLLRTSARAPSNKN